MQTKYRRTFLCGGVVLAVLNLCTKIQTSDVLLSQVKLAGNGLY